MKPGVTTYHFTKIIVLLLCSVLLLQQASAQNISAATNRNRILLGEPIQLLLQVQPSGNANAAEKFLNPDSIPHFDIVELSKIDTLGDTYSRTVTLTSFDSGRWAIPSFKMGVQATDSIVIDVTTVPMDYDKDYHDIKEIIEVSGLDTKWIYTGIGVLALLSLIAVIYFVYKSPLAKVAPREVKLPPGTLYSETMKALQQLQQEALPAKGMTKEYYVRLGDLFKDFVRQQSGIRTMEKTSGELLAQLKAVYADDNGFAQLAQALRMGDAVKFAKYEPGSEDNAQSFEAVKEAVTYLHKAG
jgi:hypothetical protein